MLAQLIANGQVATQYVGEDGKPSMDLSVNPNGSALAIEGITSPDGRVLGKMGHAERRGDNLYATCPSMSPAISSCRSLRAAWPTSLNASHRVQSPRVTTPATGTPGGGFFFASRIQEGHHGKPQAVSRHPTRLILGCLVCCALWGSAFPCIKIGYGLFGIPAHDSASQLLFAGLRFTLAGALVIVGMSAAQRRPLIPQARDIKPIFVLSLFQTIGQYFFFYLDSRAPAPCRVPSSSQRQLPRNSLCRLGISHREAQYAKVLGCVLGFAGVALVNLSGADGTFGFTLDGEGFILLPLLRALSTCLIGIFSREHDASCSPAGSF